MTLDPIITTVIARGDLAHLALLLWACGASGLVVLVLRDLARSNKRFDDFVRELARFNRRHSNRAGETRAPRPAAGPRERPTASVFRNFVRTLERLESERNARSREGSR
jgi:hypothetical protein